MDVDRLIEVDVEGEARVQRLAMTYCIIQLSSGREGSKK